MIKFSVVICTLNREEILDTCVKSLMEQTYKNYEIIIIDQSDIKNTKYLGMEPLIIYRHIDEKGLSNARNEAIDIATGEYFCLMDDDAEYKKDFLLKANKLLENNNVGILCGKIVDKSSGRVGLKGMRKDVITYVKTSNIFKYCMSPSMIINTNIIKYNKFDNEFGVGRRWGAGEETDLALRILYIGKKIIYNPFMIVNHPSLERDEINKNKVFSYNLGYGALFKKHIKKYKNKRMYFSFWWWILRNLIGVVLFSLRGNEHAVQYYTNSVKGKLMGYKEYN